ncbi:MAG: diaminopimelate decarboxylase [Planctomycetes bacterium]|nr:diaminopimelate decarboxylase [Planctomycetota bacterium]
MPVPSVPDRSPCAASGHPSFHYRGGELYCEDVAVAALVARFGSPLYAYSAAAITDRYATVRSAFGADAHVCYAVKANSNLSLLRHLDALGAGFDLVSGGELARLQAAGISAGQAVFAGVAKEPWEIEAALAAGIMLFNVESPHEIELLAAAGRARGVRVPVALRLNPDVDANTHAHLTTARKDVKFGVDLARAGTVVERITSDPYLQLRGYHVHLGSQLRAIEPWLAAFDRVAAFMAADPRRREGVQWYDLGGGFGIAYGQGEPLDVGALAAQLLPRIVAHGLRPIVEPGRYLIGDAGMLVTAVSGRKVGGATAFLLVDAAMNDLLRPALYQAEHPMAPVRATDAASEIVDVVGPVCETGDFLARKRALPALQRGDLLAVFGAGAYGSAMASNYNTRPRPGEVLVDGERVRLIRRRQRLEQLWEDEQEPA